MQGRGVELMNDFKTMYEFRRLVWDLVKVEPLPSHTERCKKIEDINEQCYLNLGEFLAPDILDALGNWLLAESFKNPDPHKVKKEEYPVLSPNQILRRQSNMTLVEDENTLSVWSYNRKNNISKRCTRNKKES